MYSTHIPIWRWDNCRWPWYYQRRSTRWTAGALGGFWMSIGQNLSPMTRYALVLGSRSCPTLSAAAVGPSLDTGAPHRPLTRPLPCSTSLYYGSCWWLETEDWPSQTILAANSGGWPATNKPRTGNVEATCSGQIDMAETHSNGYVYDKLLKRESNSKQCTR